MTDDRDLRRLFRERRDTDEAGAPPFSRVRRSEAARVRRSNRRSIAIPAIAAVAVVLAVILLREETTPKSLRPEAVASGASSPRWEDWTAPTDFLLEIPGRELLASTPPIGIGVAEIAGHDESRSKGKQR